MHAPLIPMKAPNREVKHAGVPLWRQLKNMLEEQIQQGNLPPHAKLPSENQLCNRYRISRTVVREALGELAKEQLIYKIQGKGAFVASQKPSTHFIANNQGFFAEMTGRGKRVITKVLEQSLATPSARIQQLLQLQEGEQIVSLKRKMSLLHIPHLLTNMAFPAKLTPGLESIELDNRSIYETLKQRYALKPVRSERWVEAVLPSPEQAELLGVRVSTPLIGIESCAFDANERPIEYFYTLYRSDVSRLHIES